MKKKAVISTLTALMLVAGSASAPFASVNFAEVPAVSAAEQSGYASYKYRAQLKTPEELKIYDIFTSMKENGDFARGTARISLDVDQEILRDYINGDAKLIQWFQNARDAYMLDTSDVFWVDWAKMNLRVGFDESGTYYAYIGNGAYKDFYCDNGYTDEASVLEAEKQVQEEADKIIAEANKLSKETDKIKYVHDALIERGSYLNPGDYSTFHGSNVTGLLLHNEAWCEGYSRAFQYIMQRMGMDCILVLGGGISNFGSNGDDLFTPSVEEHMWNYVQLSNGKWYAVDVTYDDPIVYTVNGIKSVVDDKFFMKGSDTIMANHVETYQFSQGGREFSYPQISQWDYGKDDGVQLNFTTSYKDYPEYSYSMTRMYPTFIDKNGKEYKGKEIVDAGYYIAARDIMQDDDGNIIEREWKDFSRTGFDYDTECLSGYAIKDTTRNQTLIAYDFCIVTNAPDNITSWTKPMNIVTTSDRVYLRTAYVDKRASTIRKIYQEPSSSYPMGGKATKVTLRYDAPIELIDPEKSAEILVSSDMYGANFSISNLVWENIRITDKGDANDISQVTFDFQPDTSMNYSGAKYTFKLNNLQSKLDGTIPPSCTLQCATPMPAVIPCVRTPSPSKLTVPIQPTLMKSSFDAEMFTDPKGNLIKNSNSTLNITLIASKPTDAEQAKLDEALGLPTEYESATFDLSLGCPAMRTALKYHSNNGTKVTLALPYPNGFDSRTLQGVVFEAYHFTKNADGSYTKEKLICNATETGIFVQADSFSPFTVVAVPESEHISEGNRCLSVITDKAMTAVTAVDSNGNTVDADLISLNKGESCTITFAPVEGYSIERLAMNGETAELPILENGGYTVTYTYDELAESNTITADFCADSVAELEKSEGITAAEPIAFDPAVCENNNQPVIETPVAEFVSDVHEASAEDVVLALPDEGVIDDPVVVEHIHTFVDGVCTDCGAYSNDFTSKLAGYSLSLKGDIGVNFYMELSDAAAADPDAYMQFTLPDGSVKNVPVAEAVKGTVGGKDCFVFSCGVAAKKMNDVITAQMFTGDKGGKIYTYTVKQYAETILDDANGYDETAKELVKAMLNYGGYSQEYFGYRTEAPANEDVDNTLGNVDINAASAEIGETEGIGYIGSSLVLKSNTAIRHYFKLEKGRSIDEFSFTYNGKVIAPVEKSGMFYVELADISANNVSKAYTIEVNGTAVTYSVDNYIAKVLDSDADAGLKNAVKALHIFGEAAKAYAETL